MPAHHDDDEPRPSREQPSIGEGTKVDLKFAVTLVIAIGSAVGSFYKLQSDIAAMRYELQAEITRVETTNDKRVSSIEESLRQIKSTNCAIARSLKVLTVECGRLEP